MGGNGTSVLHAEQVVPVQARHATGTFAEKGGYSKGSVAPGRRPDACRQNKPGLHYGTGDVKTMRSLRCIPWLLLVVILLGIPTASQAQVAVGISVRVGPPELPVYAQPVIPGPGYIWAPGYWAYGPGGYYWVPGTWVLPPTVGVLWTPGYWGWASGFYVWHGGYWGPHVGYYGGIAYGYGYTGAGFVGGYWSNGAYYYNRSVTNVNTTIIHNTYNTTVVNNNTNVSRVSYNGGTGGTTAQPTTSQLAAAREPHVAPTALQTQHERAASMNREMLASANHGQPAVAATARPGVFKGEGVVAAGRPATAAAQPAAGTAKGSATGVQGANTRATANASANPGNPGQKGVTSYAAQPPAQNRAQVQPHQAQVQPHQGQAQQNATQQQPRQGQPEAHGAQAQPHASQQQPHQDQPHQGGRPPQSEQHQANPEKRPKP
jgi:hypothetical protein